jgi:hypothetical protein
VPRAKPPLKQSEVRRVLRLLAPLSEDKRIILVGGQAVAWWARYLRPRGAGLPVANVLASKDLDFEGGITAAKQAADLLGAQLRIPGIDDHTPNTGVIVFEDRDGVRRELDFIDQPAGLRAQDVRDTAVLMELQARRGGPVPFWVMHPERCMESRIYNVHVLPGRATQLGLDQLRMSVACAREWTRRILESEAVSRAERQRAALRLNERVFRRCLNDKAFRSVFLDHGVDPFDAVLTDHADLPARFGDQRLPQMREQLGERRRRDVQNRARAERRRARS